VIFIIYPVYLTGSSSKTGTAFYWSVI